jgi:hypothetical protein
MRRKRSSLELSHNGVDVLVVQTLDPLYVVGKQLNEKQFAVPTDEEIEAVGDPIEQLVLEFEEAFEQADDMELFDTDEGGFSA